MSSEVALTIGRAQIYLNMPTYLMSCKRNRWLYAVTQSGSELQHLVRNQDCLFRARVWRHADPKKDCKQNFHAKGISVMCFLRNGTYLIRTKIACANFSVD